MPQTPPQTDTYNTALDIFDRTHPLRVDVNENLKVTLAGSNVNIGIVTQGAAGAQAWAVVNEPSTDANVISITVTTSSTLLLASNLNRKGIIIQSVNSPLFVILGSTSASTSVYSYYVLEFNALEIENFFGPVSAVVAAGTASVQVTEKI
jgi:hypothetical protein